VAIGDVPLSPLSTVQVWERATLSVCLTVGSGACLHGVVLLSVRCHDGVQVGFGLGHWSVSFELMSV